MAAGAPPDQPPPYAKGKEGGGPAINLLSLPPKFSEAPILDPKSIQRFGPTVETGPGMITFDRKQPKIALGTIKNGHFEEKKYDLFQNI